MRSRVSVAKEVGCSDVLLLYWERSGLLDPKGPRRRYVARARVIRMLRNGGAFMSEVRLFMNALDSVTGGDDAKAK